jgi:hypothetical protein
VLFRSGGKSDANHPGERHAFRPFRNFKIPFCVAPVQPRLRDDYPYNHHNEQRHVPSQSWVAAAESRPQYKAAFTSGFAASTGTVPTVFRFSSCFSSSAKRFNTDRITRPEIRRSIRSLLPMQF